MADVLSSKQRSYCMSQIKGQDTKPEFVVRRLVHSMGYRYRLHRKDLPGKPDLVFPKYGKVIFVHGCFWHLHRCKNGRVTPKTNSDFWQEKRNKTKIRDKRNMRRLKSMGWEVMVIWECETTDVMKLKEKVESFLSK